MTRLRLRTRTGTCRLLAGESFRNLGVYCRKEKTLLVVDRRVLILHRPLFESWNVLAPGRGERLKTLDVVEKMIRSFLELGADRETTIVAVGGGALCDAVGLAAGLFMRGVRLGLVPTTLLAQVDAALGGKNGVNIDGYKNIAGTIRQPDFVLADPAFLRTLDPGEIRNGLAEMIKVAAVADARLFARLERWASPPSPDRPALGQLMVRAIRTKLRIVGRDEREEGPRRLLNFGHTLGHALERTAGLSHGRAVAIGMAASALLSVRLGLLPRPEADRLIRLLRALGLPTSARRASIAAIGSLDGDKKRSGRDVRFVVLFGLGRGGIMRLPLDDLEEDLRGVC